MNVIDHRLNYDVYHHHMSNIKIKREREKERRKNFREVNLIYNKIKKPDSNGNPYNKIEFFLVFTIWRQIFNLFNVYRTYL